MQICGLDARGCRHPAERAAPGVPARAERRLSRGVHRRRADARQDGRRHPGRAGEPDAPLDLGRAFLRTLMWLRARGPRRARLPDRALQPRSTRPPRPLRRHPRRPRTATDRRDSSSRASESAWRRARRWPRSASATSRSRPGTFGSARRPAALVAAPAVRRRAGDRDRRRLRRRRRGAAASPSGTSAAPIPARSSSTK